MQTNHYVRRTELMKYFQHQIVAEYLCPKKMHRVSFFGATKEGIKTQMFRRFAVTYVTANLRNQIFPGIPNPFRESRESLK